MTSQFDDDASTWFESEFDDTCDLFGPSSDRFIDAFGGCCASLAVLLNTLACFEPAEPFDASDDIVRQLCVVAGTVGYPQFGESAPHTVNVFTTVLARPRRRRPRRNRTRPRIHQYM